MTISNKFSILALVFLATACGKLSLIPQTHPSSTNTNVPSDVASAKDMASVSVTASGAAVTFSGKSSGCSFSNGAIILGAYASNEAAPSTGGSFSIVASELPSNGGTVSLTSDTNNYLEYQPDVSQLPFYLSGGPGTTGSITVKPYQCTPGAKIKIEGTFQATIPYGSSLINPTTLTLTNGSFTCVTTAIICP